MFIDLLLIVIIFASLGYSLSIIWRTFPHVADINIAAVPQAQQARIKRQILEDKLRRDIKKRWIGFREFFVSERKKSVVNFFSTAYQKLRDLEQEYRRSSRKDLNTHVAEARSIDELLAAARQLLADEEYSRAEQKLIDSLKIDEHNVKVYILLAQVYKAQGAYDHAKETLEYILRLTNNEDASIYSNLATLARDRGDLHTAQEEYMKSITLDPSNHNYYLELAEVFQLMEQHDKAQESAQKAIVLAPNNPKTLDFLIENSILLQDKNRASEYLSKLIEVNPQNGKITSFKERIDTLGVATSE